MNLNGDPAVDFRTRDLFEDGRALIGRGLEKGGESPLGQEHRLGEALEIHARHRLDEFADLVDLRFQDPAGFGVRDFMPGLLQLAVRLFMGAALAPVAAVTALPGLEGHLGEAFAGLARHDLVAALRDLVQTGRAAVKGKTDGVHDGRLPRPRGAGDGEDAVGGIGRVGEIDLPFADQ